MTPIKSMYDVRLVTLVGVLMETIETLALQLDVNPEQLLSDNLYLVTKRVHENGEEGYLNKLQENYPLLNEAIA